jgi:hypothetical protein
VLQSREALEEKLRIFQLREALGAQGLREALKEKLPFPFAKHEMCPPCKVRSPLQKIDEEFGWQN